MRWNIARSGASRRAAVVVLLAAPACMLFPVSQENAVAEGGMDNQRLSTLIEDLSPSVEGEPGYWMFVVGKRQVVVITDVAADRMRIMTPVAEDGTLSPDQASVLLHANFDRALDARYALSRGTVWSVFIHPLRPLTDGEFRDGVSQVVTLADNYGTSFSSGALVFQGGQN